MICSDCVIIEQVSEYRYLGRIIDEHLSWAKHVSCLVKELQSMLFILLRVYNIDQPVVIYNSLCKSTLLYGLSVWGKNHCEGALNRLNKRILKCIDHQGASLSSLVKKKHTGR